MNNIRLTKANIGVIYLVGADVSVLFFNILRTADNGNHRVTDARKVTAPGISSGGLVCQHEPERAGGPAFSVPDRLYYTVMCILAGLLLSAEAIRFPIYKGR